MFKLSISIVALFIMAALVPAGSVLAVEIPAVEPAEEVVIKYRTPDEEFVQIVLEQRTRAQAELIEHVVSRGETLTRIASKYGVTVATIFQNNNITNPDRIWPGQVLTFPSFDGLIHTLGEESSVWEVAVAFSVEPARIIMANGLVNYELEKGQVLVIPGYVQPLPQVQTIKVSRTALSHKNTQAMNELPAIIWPLQGRVSSLFGAHRGSQRHNGLDIAAPTGTPIKAVASGEVVLSRFLSGYGNTVIIEHSPGFRTLYAHASRLVAKEGDQVAAGDTIALVGSTGNSTGPHLHFEIIYRDRRIDPLPILRR